ncbi:hypothetical protein AGABI2DRAFT_122941 [Agaricus bisporus var. bisporus H97]|uniref:hypothetical protein n=1 Tax=Agaricus bisporus var. bisporus (strain H97 / ATCC MYA-4626 / FGSC 10389) TaxID=936046 RepID=UPI00029F5D2B|nr:hypothetical protein AGABI2DRAFT_122941 [Agaricus bisporus var. bisporus H97]EKV42213.1 hypothetical protein AGABI2DRAFT_122941 [Agaricus bisporus var. bisporus H97]
MSSAVLPRFSELFKEINLNVVAHESLILPPLRGFPEPISKGAEQRDTESRDKANLRARFNQPFHEFSDVVPEVHSTSFDHPIKKRDWYSRDSSLSDGSLDQDEDLDQLSERQTSLPRSVHHTSQKSPASEHPKPKKVKYHFCQICQKPFPRPSGLRAHMNMHTREKPFECGYPGCSKRFSVSSNARRHLRTHGVGLSPSDEPVPLPYIVDFDTPVVCASDSDDSPASLSPLSLRWMPLGADSRRSHKAHSQTEAPS